MSTTHKRLCWNCQTTNEHASDITPGVLCPRCGSQDTRRVKTAEEKKQDERRIREQAWELAGKIQWESEDWQTFYEHLTKAFMIITARHAKKRIEGR
jgi:DNA-directed RNA polymerase subunit RPC12/RpoP